MFDFKVTFWRLCSAVALFGVVPAAQAADAPLSGGPYVPTPPQVVDEMLRMAGVTGRDYVIDLGSGDGRIVITAAQKRCVGVRRNVNITGRICSVCARRLGATARRNE